MAVIASAPAKIILFGEHFVIYGGPAIVTAIDRRAYVKVELRGDNIIHIKSNNLKLAGSFEGYMFKAELGDPDEARQKLEPVKFAAEKMMEICGKKEGLNIEISSSFPSAAGLGSSAAIASAVAAAVGHLFKANPSKEDIFRVSLEAEKLVHGNPSGVDSAISTYGGSLLFQVDSGISRLNLEIETPLIVGYTGVERSTLVQIMKVKNFRDKYPHIFNLLLNTAKEIVQNAISAIREGDIKTVGELMNINHALLYGLGVSDESLERLIIAARKAGALGAKLTGAGGGGCIVALSDTDMAETILMAIHKAGGDAFIAQKTNEGVRIEQE
ncbi:MAG: mevalonate kinase [Candidatus Bathyarchaeia archaeon]|nr:mevalonate kinase [Candidatus Bathyarchaeota archaeon]